MAFFTFMSSMSGRVLRGVAGSLIFVLGLLLVSSNPLWLIAIAVGFIVMAAGLLDLCIFAPLAGKPIMGAKLRDALK